MCATESQKAKSTGKRWVVKIGSALLSQNGSALARDALDPWVDQIASAIKAGHQVVMVSSGAVSEGMTRLGWSTRPIFLHELQATAAVGQAGLIQAYEERFQSHGVQTAQILLVHADISDRTRYLNARQTINFLLGLGVVPIVNENDTIANDEIRFGDNDTLAGVVANLVEADTLLILTDQQGVYDDDPRTNANANLIEEIDVADSRLDKVGKSSGGKFGSGGMATKIKSARLAARSGTQTVIASGHEERIISRVLADERIGTRLTSTNEPIAARKQWLGGSQSSGQLTLDAGAISALRERGVSLLAVGIKAVEGNFARGDLVCCVNEAGEEIARGLIAYSSEDTREIIGQPSTQLSTILGYDYGDEVIHRNDLVVW